MKRWKTEDIKNIVKNIKEVKGVSTGGPGGDWDSRGVVADIAGSKDSLWISGFKYGNKPDTTSANDNLDDMDIDFIELTAGNDSRGGVYGCSNLNTNVAYAKIKSTLEKLGFIVANSYEEYF